jgi:DNA-binding NtrC family response regulator
MAETGKILVVDDDKLVVWSFEEDLTRLGYQVNTAQKGLEAIEKAKSDIPDLILLDLKLPDMSGLEVLRRLREGYPNINVIIITAYGGIDTAVEAMKLGARDYVDKAIKTEELAPKISKAMRDTRISRDYYYQKELVKTRFGLENIIGKSPKFLEVLESVNQLAEVNATVLILGESGVGKDLIAYSIHRKSPWAKGPFLEINCSALPDTLLENELFGHERGAFTDAKELRKGLFESAKDGTLFLDEIGDMSLAMQAKIIKAIETKTIRRLGSAKEIKTNVRIIAATNKDIELLMAEGKFREDLYYRLKTFQIVLPPLRDREEDIPLLVNHFVEVYNKEHKLMITGVSEEAMALMVSYHWPGNVRELRNVTERGVIIAKRGIINPAHLPNEIAHLSGLNTGKESDSPQMTRRDVPLAEVEKSMIHRALEKAKGKQSEAARLLGISRHTLRYRMKKYNLN